MHLKTMQAVGKIQDKIVQIYASHGSNNNTRAARINWRIIDNDPLVAAHRLLLSTDYEAAFRRSDVKGIFEVLDRPPMTFVYQDGTSQTIYASNGRHNPHDATTVADLIGATNNEIKFDHLTIANFAFTKGEVTKHLKGWTIKKKDNTREVHKGLLEIQPEFPIFLFVDGKFAGLYGYEEPALFKGFDVQAPDFKTPDGKLIRGKYMEGFSKDQVKRVEGYVFQKRDPHGISEIDPNGPPHTIRNAR
ncbi:MAG: hypothetical protein SGI74_12785 [Oligoflexia bacterium]|nr:hypothetical protein [Oligoflexia bacterium]